MTSLRDCSCPGGRPRPRPRPVAGGLVAASVDKDGLVDASGHEDITSGVLMED